MQLLSIQSSNPVTSAKLKIIRARILDYLKKSIKGSPKDSFIAYRIRICMECDQQPTLRNAIAGYWFCNLAIDQHKAGTQK